MPQPQPVQEQASPDTDDLRALVDLLFEMAELSERATRSVRQRASAGYELSVDLAECFEQLANNHLDIVSIIASQHRRLRGS